MIEPEPLQQVDRTWVYFRGRKCSYFAGCDYFRLASHPRVLAALRAGLNRYGWSVAASRRTTGNHVLYNKLEEQLADFFKADAALILPSGYLTNLAVAQALAGQCSHALIDEAAHPSLWDATQAFDCPLIKFAHRSKAALEAAAKRCGPGARFVVLTDGMFSRDGSVAPLNNYLQVVPNDALVIVDDAHGAGVVGTNGRGSLEYCGVGRSRVIQTITLGKALGTFGGAILCSVSLRKDIIRKSHIFVGSTPLPLPVAFATLQSLSILKRQKALRVRLMRHTSTVREELKHWGLVLPETPGPIIAAKAKNAAAAARVSQKLLKSDIHPPLISYPGGPASAYFRFVISSEHTAKQLANLVDALGGVARLLEPVTS